MRFMTMIAAVLILSQLTCRLTSADETDQSENATKELTISELSTQNGVKLRIACSSKMTSGAENLVTITLSNQGTHAVEFEPIAPQALGVGLEVTRQNKKVGTTAHGARYLTRTTDPKVIAPVRLDKGEEFRMVLNLTRYFDLSIPEDTYQITAIWWGKEVDSEKSMRIQTEPLDFEVMTEPGETPLGVQALIKKD